MGMTSNFVTN